MNSFDISNWSQIGTCMCASIVSYINSHPPPQVKSGAVSPYGQGGPRTTLT